MKNKPQLYKFSEIEHRLHTLEPGQTYIKPFVTSKVSNTMCGGLNFLNKISELPLLYQIRPALLGRNYIKGYTHPTQYFLDLDIYVCSNFLPIYLRL